MEQPRKFKKHDLHPSGDGRIFWMYSHGNEYWVTKEHFDKLQEGVTRTHEKRKANGYFKRKYQENRSNPEFVEQHRAKVREYNKRPEVKKRRSQYTKENPASPEQIKYIQEWKKKKRQDPEWRKKEQATTARYNARPECKARRYEYMKGYRKRTNARLANNIRSRIRDVMKGKIKTDNTMKMLGCTAKEFMAHLQKHFERGMSFNNYGHFWSVDHVIPLARFDLTKPDHQKIAFHYTNTRPCWNDENIRKKDKLDHTLVTKHELALALEMLK